MGSRKKNEMTWPLMWRNVSVTTLNTTLQLLVIYRYRYKYRNRSVLYKINK